MQVDAAAFARALPAGDDRERELALEMLETALDVEALRPPSPLIDLTSSAAASPAGGAALPGCEPQEVAPTPAAPGEPTRAGYIFGPWRILHELGRGGFGIVYEAEALEEPDAPTVTLKILNPLSFADPARQRELLREASYRGPSALASELGHLGRRGPCMGRGARRA